MMGLYDAVGTSEYVRMVKTSLMVLNTSKMNICELLRLRSHYFVTGEEYIRNSNMTISVYSFIDQQRVHVFKTQKTTHRNV